MSVSIAGEVAEVVEIARLVGVLGSIRKGKSVHAETYEIVRVHIYACAFSPAVIARHTVIGGEVVHRVEYGRPRTTKLTRGEKFRLFGIGHEDDEAQHETMRWKVLRA